jgi:hypothetical protein
MIFLVIKTSKRTYLFAPRIRVVFNKEARKLKNLAKKLEIGSVKKLHF